MMKPSSVSGVAFLKARVINQHVKAAKTHLQERHRRLHPGQLIDPLEGVQDIRSYFQPS